MSEGSRMLSNFQVSLTLFNVIYDGMKKWNIREKHWGKTLTNAIRGSVEVMGAVCK